MGPEVAKNVIHKAGLDLRLSRCQRPPKASAQHIIRTFILALSGDSITE